MKVRTIARFSLLTALALLFGYLESLIPLVPQAPGIKLGLSNFVMLYAIFCWKKRYAFLLMVLKVALSGLLFSGIYGAAYGFCGGLLSVTGMVLLHRLPNLSVITVSACGGVLHNIGQMLLACLLISPAAALSYSPFLLISGLLAGTLLGILSRYVFRALKHFDSGEVV